MSSRIILVAILTAGLAAIAQPGAAAATGEAAFRQSCGACHSLEPSQTRMGPPLNGVFQRKAGSVPGYAYSDALKTAGITWDRKTLDRFLKSPAAFVPGTKMPIGVADDAARKATIDYLAGK